ncbi:MAG: hypothetical protein F4Z95_02910 [Gammaproteobacteria bacterium]|nr:hypothetical protein [Gammaproteobacteria bacterium]
MKNKVTRKEVIKMSPDGIAAMRDLISTLSASPIVRGYRVTQSAAVEAALFHWCEVATLDERRAAYREYRGERTRPVTFRTSLNCAGRFAEAMGDDLAVERVRNKQPHLTKKDILRAAIKCLSEAPEEQQKRSIQTVMNVGPAMDLHDRRDGFAERQAEQEATEAGKET